ncbi:WAP four-disulfide core domain protein 12-like [Arvicola amphibius]|uniref:WAP four-disulfide core domain protein 12-like n=1 Tax=Arvicola amphibius TaxID=1047088 RepID=UPI001C08D469|nr:WAP four-disulfide core domain protein 12-like [Arvicola amphibius]
MRPDSILVLAVLLISSTLVAGDGVKGYEKEGVCPPDNVRCIRGEPPQCHRDRNCEGPKKCCYWHCGFKCVQPVKATEDRTIWSWARATELLSILM